MAQPTMRLANTSLIAQRYSFPSFVQCSVMSESHNSLGADAVKSRWTRSSWDGVPGRRFLPGLGLPKLDHQALSRQIRHTTRSDTSWPSPRTSSARNRYPNSGSSPCAVWIAFARYASSSSESTIG
jgi:hypothetical protein